ncbi:MAG: hypothetical protein Q6365_016060 [Candidatus Sigynarchaeota archaeon]
MPAKKEKIIHGKIVLSEKERAEWDKIVNSIQDSISDFEQKSIFDKDTLRTPMRL